jgi:hypothetical protein
VDIYYGTAAAAREAAQLWLFAAGSSKGPARVYDPVRGYHYRVKGPDGSVQRFLFGGGGGAKKRARR